MGGRAPGVGDKGGGHGVARKTSGGRARSGGLLQRARPPVAAIYAAIVQHYDHHRQLVPVAQTLPSSVVGNLPRRATLPIKFRVGFTQP